MKRSRMNPGAVATIALASLGAKSIQANGYVQSATVVEMAISRVYGTVVFIKLSAPPVDGASCSVLGAAWTFTLSLDGVAGKELYSMLLTAAASGKQIRATGTGACSQHGQIESLEGAHIVG
jgi:hypothetical protein